MDSKKEPKSLQIIGRTANVDIPAWNVFDIRAKIDTGAYTSSIHGRHIETYEQAGTSMVRFRLMEGARKKHHENVLELPIHNAKKVKSSNGQTEERIIIKAAVVLAGRKLKAEFSLTDRSEMRYPLLIGRKLLKGRFWVDVSRTS